jgi:predicted metal-dependent RNase
MPKSFRKGCMLMRKFLAKGGYGEHGRSCFLTEYGTEGRFYMVDCGIMDSDSNPYPDVTEEELAKTDYVFLTHSHKDHSGAFMHFVEKGFRGTLVTSAMAFELSDITYDKVVILSLDMEQPVAFRQQDLQVSFGRTGHCMGGLWFLITDALGTCFFSGDYQEDTLAYACDAARGKKAELAIVDCAHYETDKSAAELREDMLAQTDKYLQEARRVIFPVPKYGRGMEMFALLEKEFPDKKVMVDAAFVRESLRCLKDRAWFCEDTYDKLCGLLERLSGECVDFSREDAVQPDYDILLLADTHLLKPYNTAFVEKEVAAGARVIVTGRVRPGKLPEKLLAEGKAAKFLYPHHQSRGDLLRVAENNDFTVVLPYHNEVKEVLVK